MSADRFVGKVAVVTGAGSGIGRGSAQRLAADGASVVVVDTDGNAAERVAAALPGKAIAVTADVSDETQVDAYLAAAVEAFGRVDFHHLNAGIFGTFAKLPDLPSDESDRVMAANVRGAVPGPAGGLPPVPQPGQRRRHRDHGVNRQPDRQRRRTSARWRRSCSARTRPT